jgi:hypothetical protein
MADVQSFVAQYAPVASQVASQLGVTPDVILGQWGLETGWGKSVVPGTHNLGNIKDFSGGGAAATDNQTGSTDKYRAYADPNAFADDFTSLIARKYQGALNSGSDASKYGTVLQSGGYAQDPNYASKLAGAASTVRGLGEFLANAISGTAQAAEVPPNLATDKDFQTLSSLVSGKPSSAPAGAQASATTVSPALAGDKDWQTLNSLVTGKSVPSAPADASTAPAPPSDSVTMPGIPDQGSSSPGGAGAVTLHYDQPAATPQIPAGAPPAQPAPENARLSAMKGFGLGVTQSIGNMGMGGAQLIGHGVNALGNVAGVQIPGFTNADVQNYDQSIERNNQFFKDAAGNSQTALGAGNLTGDLVAALAVPGVAAATLPGKIGAGMLLGGGYSALQPITQSAPMTNEDYAGNKLMQVASGATLGGVIPIAGAAAGKALGYVGDAAKAAVAPFTEAGQNTIAGNMLQRFARGGPTSVNAAEFVPGSTPTLAQATGNPGLAALERQAHDISPNDFNALAQANQEARSALLSKAAGTPDDIAQAIQARNEASSALYTQSKFSNLKVDPELQSILARPAMQKAVNRAQQLANEQGAGSIFQNVAIRGNGEGPPKTAQYIGGNGLHYIKMAIDDMVGTGQMQGIGKNESSAILGSQEKLLNWFESRAPEYGQAIKLYADASKPIDAMQYLQGLKLTDAYGNMTLQKVDTALKQIEKLRGQSGINPAKSLSQGQIDALGAIRDDLRRAGNSAKGKAIGSNTFQNLATNNLMAQMLPGSGSNVLHNIVNPQSMGATAGAGTGFLFGGLPGAGVGGLVGERLGKGVNMLMNAKNDAIQNKLIELLRDTSLGQSALNNTGRFAPPAKNALTQRLTPYLNPAATVMGVNALTGR